MILSLLASASTLLVTPATINKALATARPGAVIRLSPGNYGTVNIRKRHWTKPVTIEAGSARLTLNVTESSGLVIRGGTFVGKNPLAPVDYAIMIRMAKNIALEDVAVESAKSGVLIDRSTDATVKRAKMAGLLADGINIASSQRVTITQSSCINFVTTWGQDTHPDCIQMWSNPKFGITQDVTITKNRSIGPTQGLTGFNHVRDGIDDGGFDRIVISDNYVATIYAHAVYVNGCRNCTISGNVAESLPGAHYPAWVRAPDCQACMIERNRAPVR